MTTVYHGSITGRDDLFLESFIVTGALSGKSFDAWGQGPGFYVSLGITVPKFRAQEVPEKEARDRWDEVYPVHWGRGMIVELDTKVTADKWDIDHEVSARYSMALIENMRGFVKLAAENMEDSPAKRILETFYEATGKKKDFTVHEGIPALLDFCNQREMELHYPTHLKDSGSQGSSYYMQIVHSALRENFPEEYERENQKIIDQMIKRRQGSLRYNGNEPLKISRIYLRPEGDQRTYSSIRNWEIIYDVSRAEQAPVIPAGSSPAPRGQNP